MSYCRWSSDDFKSDVYVYESQAGWITHVKDGTGYADPNPGKCADRLEWLQAAGYHIPDGVIETLREEAQDA